MRASVRFRAGVGVTLIRSRIAVRLAQARAWVVNEITIKLRYVAVSRRVSVHRKVDIGLAA